jgi:ABC-type multidrug transport system fused ATPase/permease subunit
VTALLRLLRYARPYRLEITGAIAAMLVYAVSSAFLTAQTKEILDTVLPRQEQVAEVAIAIIGLYLLKGLGG